MRNRYILVIAASIASVATSTAAQSGGKMSGPNSAPSSSIRDAFGSFDIPAKDGKSSASKSPPSRPIREAFGSFDVQLPPSQNANQAGNWQSIQAAHAFIESKLNDQLKALHFMSYKSGDHESYNYKLNSVVSRNCQTRFDVTSLTARKETYIVNWGETERIAPPQNSSMGPFVGVTGGLLNHESVSVWASTNAQAEGLFNAFRFVAEKCGAPFIEQEAQKAKQKEEYQESVDKTLAALPKVEFGRRINVTKENSRPGGVFAFQFQGRANDIVRLTVNHGVGVANQFHTPPPQKANGISARIVGQSPRPDSSVSLWMDYRLPEDGAYLLAIQTGSTNVTPQPYSFWIERR